MAYVGMCDLYVQKFLPPHLLTLSVPSIYVFTVRSKNNALNYLSCTHSTYRPQLVREYLYFEGKQCVEPHLSMSCSIVISDKFIVDSSLGTLFLFPRCFSGSI